MSKLSALKNELEKNGGVARMKPTWLCRTFLPPGRRLKLHPEDMYPNGVDAGGVAERWFCSMGVAETGKKEVSADTMSWFWTAEDAEGISFREAIEQMGDELLGKEVMEKLGGYVMFSKFFDYGAKLPHHMHPLEEHAKNIGMNRKPESYYFPTEMNNVVYDSDYTFFGFVPGTKKEQIADCLRNYNKADNQILTLSKAYKIKLGTGWFLPAGIVHAPACVCTYEPQYLSDVSVFFQNVVERNYFIDQNYNKSVIPESYKGDPVDYLVSMMDWEKNLDPDFHAKYYHEPIPVKDTAEMEREGYYEEWISYGSADFSAKRLVVAPGKSVTIKDAAAYGFIMTQGTGMVNGLAVDTPSIIRHGQMTADECFVIEGAAKQGVTIKNLSEFTPLIMMKHFNAGNADAEKYVQE